MATLFEGPRARGRPRLESKERKERCKAAKKRYVERNRDLVKAKINALGGRPEYKARRKVLRLQRKLLLKAQAEADANEIQQTSECVQLGKG